MKIEVWFAGRDAPDSLDVLPDADKAALVDTWSKLKPTHGQTREFKGKDGRRVLIRLTAINRIDVLSE